MSTSIVAQPPTIHYRTEPPELRTTEIVAELFWLGSAVNWRGEVAEHAQHRAAALRAELRRRQDSAA